MSWTINICITLVLTSLSGTVAFLFWKVWATYMEQHGKLRWVFPMLVVVELFFVFPIGYSLIMLWQSGRGWMHAQSGYLFIGTGLITIMCTGLFVIWVSGAVYHIGKSMFKIWKMNFILRRSCVPGDPSLVMQAGDIRRKLGIRQRVLVCQSYLVRIPVVVNGFRKRIIFPIGEFDRQEAEVILSHELIHVKQKILPLKLIGSVAKVVYWFNPLVHKFMGELDEWGEIACDMSVRYDARCVDDFREYFRLILSSVERHMEFPDEWTQLTKEKGVERRIMRLRDYKRENDWKLAGGIVAMLVFCLSCTTTVAAAGVGVGSGYNKVFSSIVDDELVAIDDEVIYEEEWDPSQYNVVEMPTNQMARATGYIGWYVPSNTVYRTSGIKATGSTITVSVTCKPGGKLFNAGIITTDGRRIYAQTTNTMTYEFSVTAGQTYYVFVENLSNTTLETSGHYVY